MHPTIEQIWHCKGIPRPHVFNRWRRELWEQVGPRLEELERENEALKARLEQFEGMPVAEVQWTNARELGAISSGESIVVKRGPGRPRKHPVEAA